MMSNSKTVDIETVLSEIRSQFLTLAQEQRRKMPQSEYVKGTADGIETAAAGIGILLNRLNEIDRTEDAV